MENYRAEFERNSIYLRSVEIGGDGKAGGIKAVFCIFRRSNRGLYSVFCG